MLSFSDIVLRRGPRELLRDVSFTVSPVAKAKPAQARLKMIERIHRTVPVYADAEFGFGFPEPERLPSPLVRLDRVQAGYGQLTVLENVNLSLEPEDRIGLLGSNRAGKSTLVKLLAGELSPLDGEL